MSVILTFRKPSGGETGWTVRLGLSAWAVEYIAIIAMSRGSPHCFFDIPGRHLSLCLILKYVGLAGLLSPLLMQLTAEITSNADRPSTVKEGRKDVDTVGLLDQAILHKFYFENSPTAKMRE